MTRSAAWLTALGTTAFIACGGGGDRGPSGPGQGPDAAVELGDGGLLPPPPPPPAVFDGGSPPVGDPCDELACSEDQRCDASGSQPTCVPNECAALDCSDTERCVESSEGAHCEDNRCDNDLDCAESEWCDDVCTADSCKPGESACKKGKVLECEPNGSVQETKFECGSATPYFASECRDVAPGEATCSCEDDWDCPAFTNCEAGLCRGRGVEPSCRLAPPSFSDVLPMPEIVWGGTPADRNATGRPFPASAQVVLTPLVANLDDDNGDGLIDERDFPEIIFVTFCNSEYTTNGVLRAIHGGGPNKGDDFFATCGATVWHEGDDPAVVTCACTDADINSTANLAVGDLDDDGVPEIVAMVESGGGARIYDNTGEAIATSAAFTSGADPGPSLVNIDNEGPAEIVVGRSVLTLDDSGGALTFVDRFVGSEPDGTSNGQGPAACIANLVGDERPEILAGTTVYSLPRPPAGATRISDCGANPPTTPEETSFCDGELAIVWDGNAVNGVTLTDRAGFCAIADVLGEDEAAPPGPENPLDGNAEVITIANGRVNIFNGKTGTLASSVQHQNGTQGGPPNVDDFDGDGFPEIGCAFATAFAVVDLQAPTVGEECDAWPTAPADDDTSAASANVPRTPPAMGCAETDDCGDPTRFACNQITGECVCLHNGWRRTTEDDSSRVTGSSVFDFNGDGVAEVIYNDECAFRVYDGLRGDVLFKEPSESRTRIEYPIVADVDNDGNAEIVFATSNESGFCSENMDTLYNNGIEVWGDASDSWVSARRIWNQHAYHVTNVTESGRVPRVEPESWLPYHGRLYNTYRSNPRWYGVAPDLTPTGIQVSSPDAKCGELSDEAEITVRIENTGDLRVGPGVVVSFHGEWDSPKRNRPLHDDKDDPIRVTLTTSLEPGSVILVTIAYDAQNDPPKRLPDRVRVVVDDGDGERECDEDNNEIKAAVEPGEPLPDLTVTIEKPKGCPDPTVKTTVCNQGSEPAKNIVVRYFAGDPAQGGKALRDELIKGPLEPGDCTDRAAALDDYPLNRNLLVHATVDPDGLIDECADGNNDAVAPAKHVCLGVE